MLPACCLVIIALFIPPLAVALAVGFRCDHALHTNLVIWGAAVALQVLNGVLNPSVYTNVGNWSVSTGSWSIGQTIMSLSSLLYFVSFVHACFVICNCGGGGGTYRELGTSQRHGQARVRAGDDPEEPAPSAMTNSLSMKSSEMVNYICDCRGQNKGRNGLVNVRVPRSVLLERQNRRRAVVVSGSDSTSVEDDEERKIEAKKAKIALLERARRPHQK
ncbi:hypothetical protein JCM10212_002108 [Sporobolomyces blumeae]